MAKTIHLSPMTFRIKPDERKRIREDARAAGLSVGSYIRSQLLKEPQTKVIYRRSQLRRLIIRLIGHIGRVGNNLNQIATKLNSGIGLLSLDRERHEEGITVLKEIRALLIDFLLQGGGC